MRNNILDRRDFLRLGAAGIALASVPGLGACVRDPTTLPRLALSPNPAHARIIKSLDPSYSGFAPTNDAEYDVVRRLIKPFEK